MPCCAVNKSESTGLWQGDHSLRHSKLNLKARSALPGQRADTLLRRSRNRRAQEAASACSFEGEQLLYLEGGFGDPSRRAGQVDSLCMIGASCVPDESSREGRAPVERGGGGSRPAAAGALLACQRTAAGSRAATAAWRFACRSSRFSLLLSGLQSCLCVDRGCCSKGACGVLCQHLQTPPLVSAGRTGESES